MVMLHIKLNGITKCSNMVANILSAAPPTHTHTHAPDRVNRSKFSLFRAWSSPGRVAQSVTCLVTDACLTADPGVASSIPVRSHTFVEIDHEMISTVILLPSGDLFKKGCCQLQAKVCARITG